MATDQEIRDWYGSGILIFVASKPPGQLNYEAVIPEFNLHARGQTLEEAYANISKELQRFVDRVRRNPFPPPPRVPFVEFQGRRYLNRHGPRH
jgi:hypothetical protein